MQKRFLLPFFLLIASVLGFTPASKSAQENLIHFWLFDGDLPNDTPLTAVETQFSVLETVSLLIIQPSKATLLMRTTPAGAKLHGKTQCPNTTQLQARRK